LLSILTLGIAPINNLAELGPTHVLVKILPRAKIHNLKRCHIVFVFLPFDLERPVDLVQACVNVAEVGFGKGFRDAIT
jgi:hypothetical protein